MPYIIPRLLGKFMLCRNPKRERGSFLTDVSGYHKRCNNLRRSVKFPITLRVANKMPSLVAWRAVAFGSETVIILNAWNNKRKW